MSCSFGYLLCVLFIPEGTRTILNENHGAEPCARANDPICHVLCSEPHRPRQLGSWLILNVRQKQMKAYVSLFALLFLLGCAANRRTPVKSELGFRYLHLLCQEGFEEYDFNPNGTLWVYYFNEYDSYSGPEKTTEYFAPIFSIEKQTWSLSGDRLIIYRGAKKRIIKFNQDARHVFWGENTFSKVDHLKSLEFMEHYLK